MADQGSDNPSNGSGVKVNDRRHGAQREKKAEEQAAEGPKSAPHPPLDFTTFVLSFASTALVQMGLAPDPMTGETKSDVAAARETIDILGMLREKTRGNLTAEEQKFFDVLLYDLRVRFVELTRPAP